MRPKPTVLAVGFSFVRYYRFMEPTGLGDNPYLRDQEFLLKLSSGEIWVVFNDGTSRNLKDVFDDLNIIGSPPSLTPYTRTLGNGSLTSFPVYHGKGRRVASRVRLTGSTKDYVGAVIQYVDDNNELVLVSPAPGTNELTYEAI